MYSACFVDWCSLSINRLLWQSIINEGKETADTFSCSSLVLRVLKHYSMAPQGMVISAKCVCACACVCIIPLRIVLCECVDANGSNGLEGTGWVVTCPVPWPHTLTRNIFLLPFQLYLSGPHRSGLLLLFILLLILFISSGSHGSSSGPLVMLDFREVVGHDIASKTSQTPASCPVFPLFLLAAALGKKALVLKDMIELLLEGFYFIFGHKANVITQQFGWL